MQTLQYGTHVLKMVKNCIWYRKKFQKRQFMKHFRIRIVSGWSLNNNIDSKVYWVCKVLEPLIFLLLILIQLNISV